MCFERPKFVELDKTLRPVAEYWLPDPRRAIELQTD
jgi:hypothetical protein